MDISLMLTFLAMIFVGIVLGLILSMSFWQALVVGRLKINDDNVMVELDVEEDDLMNCRYVAFQIMEDDEISGLDR